MRTDDLEYNLPPELIAQMPVSRRDEARLMVVRIGSDVVEHCVVSELPELLNSSDLMVVNRTKVVPACFYGIRKSTGGRVEGLFLETRDDRVWHLLLQSGGRLSVGERIIVGEDHEIELTAKYEDGSWRCVKHGELDSLSLLERIGKMPLPPYIERGRDVSDDIAAFDRERYQTVYASEAGAVAAPTAGLHFTDELLGRIDKRGIEVASLTLHVGMGTFQPVRAETLSEHKMHSEWFRVASETIGAVGRARRDGRRVIAVGTTSVRALESLPGVLPCSGEDYEADTDLLIEPGYEFGLVDGLMTNFHLPRSTLLALVGAFVGLERLKELYAIAIEQRYRFYSYGDAMLILPE